MFCIGGNDVYQVPVAERAQGGGGWDQDPDVEPMDESGSGSGSDEEDAPMMNAEPEPEIEELIMPPPNARALLYDEGRANQWFHFDRLRIPHAVRTLPPAVLKAMSAWEEGSEVLNTAILLQPALPMPVHASPLVSLFENQHMPDELPAEALRRPPTWKRKYVSWAKSAQQLQQLKTLALQRVFTLHDTMTDEVLKRMHEEFCRQLNFLEQRQNDELERLYEGAVGMSASHRAIVERFLHLMENYSYAYIHLLEYLVWSLLIEPYGGGEAGIPLDSVLTPNNDTPSLDDCQRAGVAQEVIRDMRVFFRAKYGIRAAQDNAADISQFKPRLELLYDASAPEPGVGETWRGWLPREVLIDYIRWTDCDARLE